MTTVAQVSAWMEQFAPTRLAESWDNVGLLWGDPASPVEKLMTCLTVTPETAEEAIDDGVNLIVSHHPILFRPVQQIRADRPETGFLWKLARNGVAVYSPHTAFDNTEGGINDGLATRLGLTEVHALREPAAGSSFKVVVFAPAADREKILSAAFSAGAGKIGAYDECSFSTGGYGTFFGGEGTNPAVGEPGRRERVREWKLEFTCPEAKIAKVLQAVRSQHPYEEPAIDVFAVQSRPGGPGIGRIGRVAGLSLGEFTRRVQVTLKAEVQVVGDPSRRVERVAIACGAGDDFLKDADRLGADVLLTGEARFHRGLEAESRGVALVLAGHYATERPGVEDLAARLAAEFPAIDAWPSRRERDPFQSSWQKTTPGEAGG